MIGAIETALLWLTIRLHHSSVAFSGSGQQIIKCRIVVAQVFDVARFAPGIDGIDVDVGQRLLQRIKGMLRVKFRAEQSCFLGSRGYEYDRPFRRRI